MASFSELITVHLEFSHGMANLLLPDIVDKCDFLFYVCCLVYAAQQGMATAEPKVVWENHETLLDILRMGG